MDHMVIFLTNFENMTVFMLTVSEITRGIFKT